MRFHLKLQTIYGKFCFVWGVLSVLLLKIQSLSFLGIVTNDLSVLTDLGNLQCNFT